MKLQDSDIKKCEFCQRRIFFGRFCDKACIAKYACKRRLEERTRRLSKSIAVSRGKKLKSRLLPSRAKFSSALRSSSRSRRLQLKTKRSLWEIMKETISNFLTFSWEQYLLDTKSIGLDREQFEAITKRSAYPTTKNPFYKGCCLESVDPVHQSLICLTSVVQIEGYRLRLHFEGFPDNFDFWVNADCPFIFPCGFCKKTGRVLNSPKSFQYTPGGNCLQNVFSDSIYVNNTNFSVGDKLEAVDKKHHNLLCVATVTDIIGNYILVHFDGWQKDYDYWVKSSSPLIHPVGWCEENGIDLTAPPCFESVESFSWKKYLKQTNCIAADVSAFSPANQKFKVGTKLEAVDQRNPMLVRVATIVEVTEAKIKIHYDGMRSELDQWLDVDSLEIYPINWCSKTGYPLHPPVSSKNILKNICPIKECAGLGHTNFSKHIGYHRKHFTEHGCPYSKRNLEGDRDLIDRLVSSRKRAASGGDFGNDQEPISKRRGRRPKYPRSVLAEDNKCKELKYLSQITSPKRRFRKSFEVARKNSLRSSTEPDSSFQMESIPTSSLMDNAMHSSLMSSIAALTSFHLPHCWDVNVKHLPGVSGVTADNVRTWEVEKVSSFVKILTGKPECADAFKSEEVDGEALLLLTQNDILNSLKLKLGPAIKIYNAVLFFKVSGSED